MRKARITYAAPPSHPGRRSGKPVTLAQMPPHLQTALREAAARQYLARFAD